MSSALVRRTARSMGAPVLALAEPLVKRDGPYARAFENLILALIALSVVSVVVEATSSLPGWAKQALRIEEIVVVAVFSFEYLLCVVAAENKLAFIFSFYGLVDLISVAPFYIARLDVRYLRVLRLLRLLRVRKLQRRILEATVADRTRELADRHASLQQAQLNAELEVARALQIALLPSAFPAKPGCDGAARMIPATTMGSGTSTTSSSCRTDAWVSSWLTSPARACRPRFLWPYRVRICASWLRTTLIQAHAWHGPTMCCANRIQWICS
jgi:hypothetical protein